MSTRNSLKQLLAIGLLALASVLPSQAAEVGGVKIDEAVTVEGQPLKLNGAGVRTKFVFKVYAMGLYLADHKTTPGDIQALAGPKRVTIVMLREVASDELAKTFVAGLNNNSNAAEKAKVSDQTQKFEKMFTTVPVVKKGDVITLDWLPATGTVSQLNGKPLGEALPDAAFYNAVLRIWLGEKPVDDALKSALLGAK